MTVWLKVTLIVLAAVVISIGISFIPETGGSLPSLPPASSVPATQDQSLIKALFVRPPQAAVDDCLRSTHRALTHGDFVRVARCLHAKRFVSAQTVAAVEKDPLLGSTHITTLSAKTTTATWWWLLTWALALTAIAVVAYRHLRRR